MQVWTTADVDSAERQSYWIEAICGAFLTMEARPRQREGFHGRVSRKGVGPLALMEVNSVAQDVQRGEQHLNDVRNAAYYLITQRDQPWAVSQAGRYIELRAGDLVLVDASQPYQFHCPAQINNLSLELPRAWLGQWLADPGAHTAQRLDGHQGFGLGLRGVLEGLGQAEALHIEQLEGLSQGVGSLLQLGLAPTESSPVANDPRWQRARAALQARLGEAGLQAIDLAQDAGCSLATLHRLFAARGMTVASALREMRLLRAADMLRQPALSRLSVAEIGLRCGYSDPSHFGRAFAAAHGCPPARWRDQG